MVSMLAAMSAGGTRDHEIVSRLERLFLRVAIFELEGISARLIASQGIPERDREVSLIDRTPLRSAVEAASLIVGSGRDTNIQGLLRQLSIDEPRAFAVVPWVDRGRIAKLIYVDRQQESWPVSLTAELCAICQQPEREHHEAVLRPRPSTRHYQPRRNTATSRWAKPDDARLEKGYAPRAKPINARNTGDVAQHSIIELTPRYENKLWATQNRELLEALTADYADIDIESTPKRKTPVQTGALPEVEPPPHEENVVSDSVVITASGAWSLPRRSSPSWRPKLAVAAVALGPFLVSAALAASALRPVGGEIARFQITAGEGFDTIATRLEDAGIVRSAHAFRVVARLRHVDHNLRAGSYQLDRNAGTWATVSELTRGQVHLRRITIPEGLTLNQISQRVANEGLMSAEAFLDAATNPALLNKFGIPADSAEGYLLPETYRIDEDLAPEELLVLMIEHFFEAAAQFPSLRSLAPNELHQHVILASIVERESRKTDEMKRIAGVFKNRLSNDMRLESCATIQHILGEPKVHLTLDDIRIVHPYNTYLNEGLPPGPIANPGRTALAAVAEPEHHNFFFFLAREDGSGRHYFSRNFREHQRLQEKVRQP